MIQWELKTAVGSMFIVASEKGLRGIYWKKQDIPFASSLRDRTEGMCMVRETIEQIESYLRGDLKKFTLQLDLIGTEFQKQVWAELLKIPYGKTLSYKELAEKVNKPKACRAVGTANGRNPISIVVPCHRVIASDGTLGGYAGGLPVKSKLLALEGLKL